MANEIRCRGYVLTINEKAMTSELSYDGMEAYISKKKLQTEYYCYNEEKGDGGNLHVHLYLELLDCKSFSSICKKFPGAHVEPRRGTPTEARLYVQKPAGVVFSGDQAEKSHTVVRAMREVGDFSRLGAVKKRGTTKGPKENINQKLKRYVEEYDSIEEVENVDLWFTKQYRSVLVERFLAKKEQALFDRIGETVTGSAGQTIDILHRKVYYLFGDSRVGKTYGVKMKRGSKDVYTTSAFEHPWDDYKGQSVLHLDEFRSEMSFKELLVIFQGYREDNKLSARYTNTVNLSDTIIVSTNIPIGQQYRNIKHEHPESWQAFYNRFNAGIWEMVYSPADDTRYICCISTPEDYSPAARKGLDFSEPPVDINDGVVWVKEREDFYIAKALIEKGKPAHETAVQEEKEARAKALAACTGLPF